MLKDLLKKARSYRRFYQDVKISLEELKDIIDHTRYTSSTANYQPLRYVISNSEEKNEMIFSTLKWAAYLKDWAGPKEEEKPAAYIVILSNKPQLHLFDPGIVLTAIMLAAAEKGFGGCAFASVDKSRLRHLLEISDEYEIQLVVALGKPKEDVIIEEINKEQDIKYWRDEKSVHHVPKIKLEDLIIKK